MERKKKKTKKMKPEKIVIRLGKRGKFDPREIRKAVKAVIDERSKSAEK